MLKSVCNRDYYEQPLQITDKLKCGEVYTWLCDGELYAVECKFCEDHPLCPLSEFPQHMEIWHTAWEEATPQDGQVITKQHFTDNEEENQNVVDNCDGIYNNDRNLSFANEDCGEANDRLQDERTRGERQEILEPFEQVLIQQDNTTHAMQINEDDVDDEAEYLKDVNVQQVAVFQQNHIENKHKRKQKQTYNVVNHTLNQQGVNPTDVTESERELQCLTAIKESEQALSENETNETNDSRTKHKFEIKTKVNAGRRVCGKYKNSERKITNINRNRPDTSDIESSCAENSQTTRIVNKNAGKVLVTKSMKKKNFKIKNIKRTLSKIMRDINDLRECDETESKSSENESMSDVKNECNYQNANRLNSYTENKKNCAVLRNNCKSLKRPKKAFIKKSLKSKMCIAKATREAEKETTTTTTTTEKETSEKDSETSEMENETARRQKSSEAETDLTKFEMIYGKTEKLGNKIENVHENNKKYVTQIENVHMQKTIWKKNFKYNSEKLRKFRKNKPHNETTELTTEVFKSALERKSNDRESKQNKSVINTIESETVISDNETTVNENKREPIENETSVSRSNTKLIENRNTRNEANKIENKKENNATKLYKNKSNSIFTASETITSESETLQKELRTEKEPTESDLNTRVEECLRKSLEMRTIAENWLNKTPKKAKKLMKRINNKKNLQKTETAKILNEKIVNKLKVKEPRSTNASSDDTFFECMRKSFEMRKKVAKLLKINCKEKSNKKVKDLKISAEPNEKETEKNAIKTNYLDYEEVPLNCFKNLAYGSEIEPVGTNGNEILVGKNVGKTQPSRTSPRKLKIAKEEKQKNVMKQQEFCGIETNKIGNHKNKIQEAIKSQILQDLSQRNEFKEKLRNFKPLKQNSTYRTGILDNKRCKSKRIKKGFSESSSEIIEEHFLATSSTESCEISLPFAQKLARKRLCETMIEKRQESNLQAEEQVSKEHSALEKNCANNIKQTLVEKFFLNKDCGEKDDATNAAKSQKLEHTSNKTVETLTPASPKTEEDHFEFCEPKEKLNKQHITQLIKLYHEHARLWDQSHPEFCEPQICRKSWQDITDQWNEFCKRKFTIAEVRIRICTLCQRFVQERERLILEGEIDECAKFPYYKQMLFLEEQKSLQKRRELYDRQNEKILEIYQHFPILWHIDSYKLRKAKERAQAVESISKTLKLFGLHLSSMSVLKRIRSLRKCYRLEKIRYLHAQVEQTPFDCTFKHYERMQFLHKHIDPFACRSCGKIFETLQSFRQHLESEMHGSILQEESEGESDSIKGTGEKTNSAEININKSTLLQHDKFKGMALDLGPALSPIAGLKECFTDCENSKDILQRFTPLCSSPITNLDTENTSLAVPEALNFSLNSDDEASLDSLHLEDQLIQEIIENVANNDDSLTQEKLNQFINSITSGEADQDFDLCSNNYATEEVLSPNFFHTENSFVVEHPDIVTEQTSSVLQPTALAENFNTNSLYTENPFVAEHAAVVAQHSFVIADIATGENLGRNLQKYKETETFFSDLLQNESSASAATDKNLIKDIDQKMKALSGVEATTHNELEQQKINESGVENFSPTVPLVANVQCADFSVELNLTNESVETLNSSLIDSDNEILSSADFAITPLPDQLIHKLIEVYRKFPQLWNPNHLDFNSRAARRQAWHTLTQEFNSEVAKEICWRTLHRKLTDYSKYYKKLMKEQKDYESIENKWAFYDDFKFMDDVIDVNTELQRSINHRDNNLKIIAIYKTLPQLWDTKDADYNKRDIKHRNIEIMCNKLLEDYNLQLTTERLKNRLIELRTQYRTAKKERLKCLKNKQKFSSNNFEYYEALNFLDDHIDPFICEKCKMEFKKRTDYNQHLKKNHSLQNRAFTLLPLETSLNNVCHICGQKFTTRSNLVHHVKRHEGTRNHACPMCPKKFFASHSLKVHIRSHTKECPYTCEKCGMSFVSASKLNQHVKRHLNKKDFQCNFCAKTFFSAYEKSRHERRHLNIRDKACPICGKTFVAGSSYYAHLMLHNEKKRFECDKCDMKFAQYAGLYKHKKRHHT